MKRLTAGVLFRACMASFGCGVIAGSAYESHYSMWWLVGVIGGAMLVGVAGGMAEDTGKD